MGAHAIVPKGMLLDHREQGLRFFAMPAVVSKDPPRTDATFIAAREERVRETGDGRLSVILDGETVAVYNASLLLFPNRDEFAEAGGFPARREMSAKEAAKKLAACGRERDDFSVYETSLKSFLDVHFIEAPGEYCAGPLPSDPSRTLVFVPWEGRISLPNKIVNHGQPVARSRERFPFYLPKDMTVVSQSGKVVATNDIRSAFDEAVGREFPARTIG